MQRKKFFLFRWIDGISELTGYLSGFAILLAALVVFEQVVLRYILQWPSIWQNELGLYLLMFSAFVGGAYGLKHGAHVGVDLIVIRLPKKAQLILKIIVSVLCLLLIVVVGWKAWEMWWEATVNDWHSETLWGPPLTYPYFILPLGMTLIALQYIVIISETVQELVEDGRANGEVSE